MLTPCRNPHDRPITHADRHTGFEAFINAVLQYRDNSAINDIPIPNKPRMYRPNLIECDPSRSLVFSLSRVSVIGSNSVSSFVPKVNTVYIL